MSHQFATAHRPETESGTSTILSASPGHPDPWKGAPFDAPLAKEAQALVSRLSPVQRAWFSGYLAGSLATQAAQPGAAPAPQAGTPVTILYGSQSGNGERLARQAAARLESMRIPCRVLDMLDCRKADLEQARQLLVVVSTHGDGEPPARAVPLFELLGGRKAPRLPQTQFAVLALGDRSYEQFCAAGQQIDARLEQLGARRLQPRVDCDVEFESSASAWMDSVSALLADSITGPAMTPAAPVVATISRAWTRRHPFPAALLANLGLTARGSSKDVRHVELSLEGSGIQYEPGDALGIVPSNAGTQVDAVLEQLQYDAEAPVWVADSKVPLRTALLRNFEIGTLTPSHLRRYTDATGHAGLQDIVGDKARLHAFARGRDLRDLLSLYPPRGLDAVSFAALLSPLAPRLYSIASSQKAVSDEVHLTVGVVSYASHGRDRQGVVSGAIAGLDPRDAQLPVYLHRNDGFRLPADPSTSIVMIGAGTGVAPYRGFMADREATGASGRNWLFFGDRSFELDFLYQSEWLAWRRSGLLSRLDVAFSRDQAEKVYIQHRLREQGAELWRWLQEGAHLYVCGDATHMAPDVEAALLEMVGRHGGLDADTSRDYLRQLQRERRYQKDVY